MITQGKWLVSSSTIVCDEKARIIANCCPVDVPGLDVTMAEAVGNARLIAGAKDLLDLARNIARGVDVDIDSVKRLIKEIDP
jgi:hypothetical protein